MFVFYAPDSNSCELFRAFEKAWTAGGWSVRILTRRMALKDRRAKTAISLDFPWLALLSCNPKEDLFCESMGCRPNCAAGVHEVPDRAYVEARC